MPKLTRRKMLEEFAVALTEIHCELMIWIGKIKANRCETICYSGSSYMCERAERSVIPKLRSRFDMDFCYVWPSPYMAFNSRELADDLRNPDDG